MNKDRDLLKNCTDEEIETLDSFLSDDLDEIDTDEKLAVYQVVVEGYDEDDQEVNYFVDIAEFKTEDEAIKFVDENDDFLKFSPMIIGDEVKYIRLNVYLVVKFENFEKREELIHSKVILRK